MDANWYDLGLNENPEIIIEQLNELLKKYQPGTHLYDTTSQMINILSRDRSAIVHIDYGDKGKLEARMMTIELDTTRQQQEIESALETSNPKY